MNLENQLIFNGLRKLAASTTPQKKEKKEEDDDREQRVSRRRVYRPVHNSLLSDMARDALTTSAVAVPTLTGFAAGRHALGNLKAKRPASTGLNDKSKSALIAAAIGSPIVGAAHGALRHIMGE
jgi:hypothetical protein